jgi:hypothetical protein
MCGSGSDGQDCDEVGGVVDAVKDAVGVPGGVGYWPFASRDRC